MIDERFMAADPQEVGVDASRLGELLDRARKEVDEGLLPSVQVAIARKGKLAAFETYGDAPEDPLYCVFSSTKAVTSAAGWLMIQEGKLDIGEKVASIIPEFGDNGKEKIYVEQLFTHTAGFPHAPFRATDWNDKELRVKRFGDWKLNWEPGSRFEYHPTSSMWVIAEIVERRSGVSFQEFVRKRIAEPLGLADMWLGLPAELDARVAEVIHVGDALTSEDYAKLGLPEPPVTEVTEEALTSFNTREVRAVPVPGGGGIMSAAVLALFYQALINGGRSLGGEEIWKPETIEYAREVRTGELTDLLYGQTVHRALGVCVAGDEKRNLRGFGHTNSELAFGHAGAGGQIAWADPKTGISFGYCTNGHDRNPLRQGRRGVSLSNRAAVCALADD